MPEKKSSRNIGLRFQYNLILFHYRRSAWILASNSSDFVTFIMEFLNESWKQNNCSIVSPLSFRSFCFSLLAREDFSIFFLFFLRCLVLHVETLSFSIAIYEGYVVQHCRESFSYSVFKMFEWKPQSISGINTGFWIL